MSWKLPNQPADSMLALAMPVMGFVPTIVPRSAPVRMQVGRTRA